MTTDDRMLCVIHGHFYQPPRENPWLEELERDGSAAPHHDWNARISDECYAPNTSARMLDGEGRVTRLFDNYARMSFNIGPTLTSWMQRHAPETLEAIVRADAASVQRLGQGNAIGQVFNHIIMPLANERDKRTQIRWGKRAFAKAFGRETRGLWLAETAIDAETLEVLADEGIDFTILSPFQAARFRVDGGDWNDCGDGSIPTGRAYRYTCRSGKVVHLFFYDAGIARGVAFEGLLSDANRLVDSLRGAHEHRSARDEPWLVQTATDGESYGHHFHHGDMALAAAHAKLEGADDVEIVNYATFLDRHGARADVELHPVSAWSCSHGVGRWEGDCGCKMSHDPPSSQHWRAGLRAGLNGLRDGLAEIFEREGAAVLKDAWAARDAYVDVVLDRGQTDAFIAEHGVDGLDDAGRERALRLLEMQRCALLMFTSCGWFFDDISGPEGVILLRYAARAVSLARGVDVDGADRVEQQLLESLSQAESNYRRGDGSTRTGRDIYLEDAVTAAMGADRIAITLALTAAMGEAPPSRLAAWRVVEHEERAIDEAMVPTVVGRLSLLDERMGERVSSVFVVVGFGGLDWRGVLIEPSRFDDVVEALRAGANAAAISQVIDDEVRAGGRAFALKDASNDVRGEIIRRALARRIDVTDSVIAELLLAERALLRGAVSLGGGLSPEVRGLMTHALTRRVKDIVAELTTVVGSAAPLMRRLQTTLEDAREFGLTIEMHDAAHVIEHGVTAALGRARDTLESDPEASANATTRACRLLKALAMVAGPERRSWRVLKAGSSLVDLVANTPALEPLAAKVLPLIDAACRSAFADQVQPRAPEPEPVQLLAAE